MPEPKRPLKVFLCHASADKPAVRNLYQRLVSNGVDAWLDAESLVAGQNWQVEIPKAIRESDVVIVCLSEKSINKEGYVQREIKFALDVADEKPEGTIFVIPARLEECKVPDRLSMYHWVDLFEDDGYERLMRALQRRADNIGATLQIKRSWLPKITSPRPKQQKSIEIKTLEKSDSKILNTKDDDMPLSPDWQPLTEAEETHLVENPQNKTGNSLIVPRNRNHYIISAGILLLVLFLASVFGLPLLVGQPEQTSTPTSTKKTTATVVISSTKTREPSTTPSIPTSTKIPTATIAPTPLPTEITDTKSVTMRLVPVGEFTMGTENGVSGEQPVHQVYLDDFYMDIYEVTNQAYTICVTEGVCTPPAPRPRIAYVGSFSINQGDYYSWPGNPIASVSWEQAQIFCEWRSARLPTEAEWEKAARGIDGRTYPWGEEVSCDNANYSGCNDYAVYVGVNQSPSPYGVYGMAGNVWEWVADWYSEGYYIDSPLINPLGPTSGKYRVIRGGAWNNLESSIRTTIRKWENPSSKRQDIGFRCAKDVNP